MAFGLIYNLKYIICVCYRSLQIEHFIHKIIINYQGCDLHQTLPLARLPFTSSDANKMIELRGWARTLRLHHVLYNLISVYILYWYLKTKYSVLCSKNKDFTSIKIILYIYPSLPLNFRKGLHPSRHFYKWNNTRLSVTFCEIEAAQTNRNVFWNSVSRREIAIRQRSVLQSSRARHGMRRIRLDGSPACQWFMNSNWMNFWNIILPFSSELNEIDTLMCKASRTGKCPIMMKLAINLI